MKARSKPTAEIIVIGDELTSGQRLDTNSRWLSQRLEELGIHVRFHTVVADDMPAMLTAFAEARRRVNVVLVTGGLGPTGDDLTRQALASAAEVELIRDETSLDHIRQLFARRGREMPSTNVVQAMIPEGAKVIPNPTGTAPGIDLTLHGDSRESHWFALPGVPAELKPMWHQYVKPALQGRFPNLGTIVHHAIHCFGLAESDVEARIPDMIERGREPSVGITASKATITLRITASGLTEAECHSAIGPTAEIIRRELGDFIFGENGTSLSDATIQLLRKREKTFAVVDAGGCGLIADWLQEVDPLGKVYRGTLSVPGPSDPQMIDAARKWFAADWLLWIGPIFDRDGMSYRQVAIHTNDDCLRSRFPASANPAIVVPRSIKQALNFLRLSVLRGKC